MKISGFTIAKNACKLYYPVKPAIQSILPIVDELVIALGNCDVDDETENEILSIQSDKIKIIKTIWDTQKFPNGMEYARQTDLAKEACSGDWLFYIQCDEVIHENYLPLIREACLKHLDNPLVEGFLFKYKHFWGDYEHFVVSHAWYPREIRIVRNDKEIHSWRDAQSFRRMPLFDKQNYYQKENTQKLNVIELDAEVYHYGFVRPPELMQQKNKNHRSNYLGKETFRSALKSDLQGYDYGDLSKLELFTETHPAVMQPFLEKFDWADQLNYGQRKSLAKQKHEKLKYRFITWLEQHLLGGRQLFGFKNYKIIR